MLINILIYSGFFLCVWPHWVFVAVHGLSLVAASGGYSSLWCTGFSLWWLLCVEHRLQVCRLQQLWLAGSRAQAQWLWRTGLAAPRHVGSSWTRARTCVPCIGRQILNHCATREVPRIVFNLCIHTPVYVCVCVYIYKFFLLQKWYIMYTVFLNLILFFFIQQVLISYLFYTYQCIHVNPNLPIHHTTNPTFPPWCPYVCSLHLCLYFCLANQFICTIFLDSTYMH